MHVALFVVGAGCSRAPGPPPPAVLVFTGGDGPGSAAFDAIASEVGVSIERTGDAACFDDARLASFAAVVFLGTRASGRGGGDGDRLDAAQERALRRFVQSGGGIVAFRAAAATWPDWRWFTRLVGARAGVDAGAFEFRSPRVESVPLASGDGRLAWRQTYDGGRSFFVDLASDDPAWSDEAERARVADGLAWVLDGGARRPERVLPDDETFLVETLVDGLRDPIELAVSARGDVFILEREGELKRYDAKHERLESVHRFEVASKTEAGGVAQECGGLGLALDPEFERNGHVYVYRTPREPSVHRLSRFTFRDGGLVDERVLLDVATDRENTTCHEGGSLAFGPDGDLYVSTGDNTNPFDSDGFAPLDERPDRKWWDAQRSAGNSNDLRGSVLRIRPLADGGYAIPAGNLWPEGTPRTRPEIFAKGCRNPYRISIDPRTGTLYWGDVGPDADVDADGNPEGTDELNQAKEAGYFGWPYLRGGRPYRDRDFETGAYGASLADAIVNDSPHADGLAELPPPVAPFLAYPYREAESLPELGDGGRNAMAGPILYSNGAAGSSGATGGFPAWFDRVLVVYDWSRARLWLAKLDEQERFETLHPWLADRTFEHPIDLERGADGALYLLEYGSTWWDNEDGRLRRVSFGGFDRRPRVRVTPSVTSGAAPLAVTFATDGTVDPEAEEAGGDPTAGLGWRWKFGDGATSTDAAPVHEFRRIGTYEIEAVVSDRAGLEARWTGTVVVGNTAPTVRLATSAVDDTFRWGETLGVLVDVADPDEAAIDPTRLAVTAEYLEGGLPDRDVAAEPLLPGMNPRHLGTRLLAKNACASCHHPRLASSGPSFEAIATRYHDAWMSAEAATRAQLVRKVKDGGFGVWGNQPMSAHRHIAGAQIENMIDAIFAAAPPEPLLVVDGRVDVPRRPDDWRDAFGVWRIRATYSDVSPQLLLPSLTTTAEILLEAPPVVTPLGLDEDVVTVIPGPTARIDGDDATRGERAIEWWSDEATTLTWTVRAESAGTWDVAVDWGSADHEAGSAFALEIAARSFEGIVPATGARDVFTRVELGSVDFGAGTHEVRLRVTRIAERFAGDVGALLLTRE